MMRPVQLCLICFLAFATLCLAYDKGTGYPIKNKEWEEFKQRYGKNYSSKQEDSERKKTFEANYAYVEQHNKEADEGKHNFTCAINVYSDLSEDEFGELVTGLKMPENVTEEENSGESGSSDDSVFESRADLPASIDWRTKGYVTGVKNQGACGSCWAYASVGALEGQNFRATGKLVLLSEQNLIDCVLGKDGCHGAFPTQAFQYVKTNGGIATAAAYPNIQSYSGGCKFQKNTVGATTSGYVVIPKGSEAALQQALATVGPVTIGIDVKHTTFQHYKSGVYYEPSCSTTDMNHAVLAVGYGTENGIPYYILKNSWGESWGNKGYILTARNYNNNCGVATMASYPTVAARTK